MRASALTVVLGVLTLGIATPTDNTVAAGSLLSKRPATVLALRPEGRLGMALVRLDRRTLALASKRRLLLGKNLGAWARSPDGRRLAIGVEETLGLRIVDTARMRRAGWIGTRNGQIRALAWLRPNRIVGAEETGVFVVDPVARRLVSARATDGQVVGFARTANALLLLLSPDEGIGPATLALLSADGDYRAVVLQRISAGWYHPAQSGEPPGEHRYPGLAVDPASGHAYVVGGGEPVAQVDLRSLSVSYHEPSRPVSLFGRLKDWLEPRAHAKGPMLGSTRRAIWLGNGKLAVTGEDGRPGRDGVVTHAAGLKLLDTRTWSVETLHRDATTATMAAGTLLASTGGSPELSAIGLRGYDLRGDQRFHLFGARAVSVLERLDERVFVHDGASTHAIDARTGRVLRAPRELPHLLVGTMQPY